MGLSLMEARRFPHTLFWPMFKANERRKSRASLHWMEDLVAVSGLQGEMKEVGGKTTPAPRTKTIPVGYMRHLEKRKKEGWPSRRIWSEKLERKAQDKFWGDLGDLPVLNLMGDDDGEEVSEGGD